MAKSETLYSRESNAKLYTRAEATTLKSNALGGFNATGSMSGMVGFILGTGAAVDTTKIVTYYGETIEGGDLLEDTVYPIATERIYNDSATPIVYVLYTGSHQAK